MVGFISYDVDNDKQFSKALREAFKQVNNLRFPLGEISRDIYKNSIKNFILKGDGQYPPLSPFYKARKKKVRPRSPILVFDGNLRDSVTRPRDKNTIRQLTKTSLVQGTKLPYARFVQEGTRKMPARKYYFLDDDDIIRLTRIIKDYVDSKLEVLGNVK